MSESKDWVKCRVESAGPVQSGRVMIELTDILGNNKLWPGARWFEAATSMKSDMLSTALAAIATGVPVRVGLLSTEPEGVIDRIYLTRNPA